MTAPGASAGPPPGAPRGAPRSRESPVGPLPGDAPGQSPARPGDAPSGLATSPGPLPGDASWRTSPGPLPGDAPSGLATDRGNAAPRGEIRGMFDRISGVYDPLNLLISAFQEPRWRRRAVALAAGPPRDARDRRRDGHGQGRRRTPPARRAGRAGSGRGPLAGHDRASPSAASPGDPASRSWSGTPSRCRPPTGRSTPRRSPSGCATCPTTGPGSRRWPASSGPAAGSSAWRSARPRSPIARIMRAWFDGLVPLIGRLAGQGGAYRYLVRSVQNYPDPERVAGIMRDAGLVRRPLDPHVGRDRHHPRRHRAGGLNRCCAGWGRPAVDPRPRAEPYARRR